MITKLIELFSVFFRIGVCSIGGGYVMLPMMRREIVEQRDWISDDDLLNFYAIGQSTPGIIAINTATFVGFMRAGVPGALVAVGGMVGPSLIIITIIAAFFARFQDVALVQQAFRGIRVAVAVILAFTIVALLKKAVRRRLDWFLVVLAFGGVVFVGVSPVPIIISAAFAGMLAGGLSPSGRCRHS